MSYSGIDPAFSRSWLKCNPKNQSNEFSYQDSVFTPYLNMVNVGLNSIDMEKLKRDNMKYKRMFYIRKKMGKLFDMDRYFGSCKNILDDISLLKRRVSCFNIKPIKRGKRR